MLAFAPLAAGPLATANVASGAFVAIPSAGISVPPVANVNLAGDAPAIVTGVTVTPEQGRITLIKRAPQAVSTGVRSTPDAILVYDLFALRPQILTGLFSERRIRFVDLRQAGSN